MTIKTFKELEYEGWEQRAAAYEDLFTIITRQAIGPILGRLGEISNKHLLDVACGPGHLVGRASEQGAMTVGLDFSQAMVKQAALNYPQVSFLLGDAEVLSYPDRHFDVVTCAFGLMHFENPESAMAEAFRVLQHGGRYVFTVWCSPQEGHEFLELVFNAIQRYGSFDVPLPPAPPMFRFTDESECRSVLEAIGFSEPVISVLPLIWYGRIPQDVLDLTYKSIVRIPIVLAAQSNKNRLKINQAILDGANQYRTTEGIRMSFRAKLVLASKP
jgi:SAM-dependent methyltransferase